MNSVLDYSEKDPNDILKRTRRRKYYYQICHLVSTLNQWVKSVYKPFHPTDRQSLLMFTRSILESTTHIQNLTKDLISLLEEDNVSQSQETC